VEADTFARIERLLTDSGLSYSILRPAVLFGDEGILINNIAWLLRRFPFYGIFGDGSYRLRPIYVDDLAKLALEKGKETENSVMDAVGPETFSYRELVETIGRIIGEPRPIISMPPVVGFLASNMIGGALHDRLVTWDEIEGLMAELLYVDSAPAGKTELTEWATDNATWLGTSYFSEIGRRSGGAQ
jgi:NADH dehydrogenase